MDNYWLIIMLDPGESDLRDVSWKYIKALDKETALSKFIDNDWGQILSLINLNTDYRHRDDDINQNAAYLTEELLKLDIDDPESDQTYLNFLQDNKQRFIKFLSNLDERLLQIIDLHNSQYKID